MENINVSVIGAGNVAHHLAVNLQRVGCNIRQVASRSESSVILAKKVNAQAVKSVAHLDRNSDLYLIAVNDDQINSVSELIPDHDKLIVHTSGSVSINVLPGQRVGVFYPLQTFSKDRNLDFTNLPICVEAKQPADLELLLQLGQLLSQNVSILNSEQRKAAHLAAIFANNFTNHLVFLTQELCEAKGVNFDLLRPLLTETFVKINQSGNSLENQVKKIQTGPARRNDQKIIAQHLVDLGILPRHSAIYQTLSNSIIKTYNEL